MIPGRDLMRDFSKTRLRRYLMSRGCSTLSWLSLELYQSLPCPLSGPRRLDRLFLISRVACQIFYGSWPTLPTPIQLHLLVNTTSQRACLMWLRLKASETKVFSFHLWIFASRKLCWFADALDGRPKAGLTKPSKAPCGSQDPCVSYSPRLLSPVVHYCCAFLPHFTHEMLFLMHLDCTP